MMIDCNRTLIVLIEREAAAGPLDARSVLP